MLKPLTTVSFLIRITVSSLILNFYWLRAFYVVNEDQVKHVVHVALTITSIILSVIVISVILF